MRIHPLKMLDATTKWNCPAVALRDIARKDPHGAEDHITIPYALPFDLTWVDLGQVDPEFLKYAINLLYAPPADSIVDFTYEIPLPPLEIQREVVAELDVQVADYLAIRAATTAVCRSCSIIFDNMIFRGGFLRALTAEHTELADGVEWVRFGDLFAKRIVDECGNERGLVCRSYFRHIQPGIEHLSGEERDKVVFPIPTIKLQRALDDALAPLEDTLRALGVAAESALGAMKSTLECALTAPLPREESPLSNSPCESPPREESSPSSSLSNSLSSSPLDSPRE